MKQIIFITSSNTIEIDLIIIIKNNNQTVYKIRKNIWYVDLMYWVSLQYVWLCLNYYINNGT